MNKYLKLIYRKKTNVNYVNYSKNCVTLLNQLDMTFTLRLFDPGKQIINIISA
jgi:hypothetical protein